MADEELNQESEPRTEVLRPEDDDSAVSHSSTSRGPSDDYAICGKIGGGGMGVVYIARDRRLGRYVAIKRLNEKALKDPALRQRFMQEARAVATLNHAYIVHIYSLGEDALGPYIVMEYVAGPPQTEVLAPMGQAPSFPRNMTLEQYIHRHGTMTADEAVAMILKISNSMVYAHSRGVIHRDLKPSNILLDPSKEPKLVDFGLAHIAANAELQQVDEGLTVPGEKLISLGYSAPELESDASTSDVRADVYSLGAVLYFLMTERNPRYYREQDVPVYLREVLRRSLEPVREQRFSTVQDFVNALMEASTHGQTMAPTVKTSWRCKWCDAVNPVTTKFCAECGWDGTEHCLECGAEIFVGQQYCPSCGANCRMYEHAHAICRQIEQAWKDRHFERIENFASRLHGFEPSGPSGRQLLMDAQKRAENAERSVARRTRLAMLIPNELKAENYERALSFIEEFRQLNEDPTVYEEELKAIPGQILSRDLVRIRHCVRTHDWKGAQQLVQQLTPRYGSEPEFQDVKALLSRRKRVQQRWAWGTALLATAALYLLSVPWMARLLGGDFTNPAAKAFFTPARMVAQTPLLGTALNRYVAKCDAGKRVGDYFEASLPDSVIAAQNALMAQLEESERSLRQSRSSALVNYGRELQALFDKVQPQGGVDALPIWDALNAYRTTQDLTPVTASDPDSVVALKQRAAAAIQDFERFADKDIRNAVTVYQKELDKATQAAMQAKQMKTAQAIRAALESVMALPQVARAMAQQNEDPLDAVMTGTSPLLTSVTSALETSPDEILTDVAKDLLESQTQAEQSLGDWQTDYLTGLQEIARQAQQDGDFNGWEVITGERTRFMESHQLPQLTSEAERELPEELLNLRKTIVARITEAVQKRTEAQEKIFAAAAKQLVERRIEETKAGDMRKAKATDNTYRRLCGLFGKPENYDFRSNTVTASPEPVTTAPIQE